MHVVYVDDTKQRGRRRGMGQLNALGAVIFDEAKIQPFGEGFRELYDEFAVPHEVELKWSNPQGQNWWGESDENKAKQTPMRERVLQLARAHGARVVVVVWDDGAGVSTAGTAIAFALADHGFGLEDAEVELGCLPAGSRCTAASELVAVEVTVHAPLPFIPDGFDLAGRATIPVSATSSFPMGRFDGGAP